MYSNRSRFFLIAALTAALSAGAVPTVVMADTSDQIASQLETAQAKLADLYDAAESASEDLNGTRVALQETEARISENEELAKQKQAELDEASHVLSEVVSADYKNGRPSLISIIFSSSSVDEMLSSIIAANKVVEYQQRAIQTVRETREELNATRSALEADRDQQRELVAEQEERTAELEARADEAQSYVDGLSAELQDALAAEEAARQAEAERRAEEARKAAEASEAVAARSQAEESEQGSESENVRQQDTSSTASRESTTVSQTPAAPSSSVASTVVNAAVAQVGCAYVWGASSPGVAFDCSGLVMYCYSCAGYSLDHYSESQAAYCNKPASQAVAGDIVWRPGHVGICIGNGVTVEAFSPGRGVGYGSVSGFVSAGSPA